MKREYQERRSQVDVRRVTEDYPIELPESKTPRSEGVHVSSIIRCIATETGILKSEWAEELSLVDVRQITDPTAVLRINMGLAWEQHYIGTLMADFGISDHSSELEVDSIYCSPDAEQVSVIITPGRRKKAVFRVHEIKLTYKSTKTVGDLSSQWMWLTQIKAYCRGLGTRFAVIHILFVCGDYTYPIKPVREVYEIEFTQEEIDDCWNLLRDYRDQRLAFEAKQKIETT
jgi:hypothetical protein